MRRPFKGLRSAPPRPSYDAVVVGAGIGGLFCANLLARQGRSVLLVEQHYMAGGYCSTFRRKGFTFDAASHFYPLLGNPETLTGKLLSELSIDTEWVKMDPVDTFHFPDGSRFDVPADYETYRSRLAAEFPHQAEAIERFFVAVREAYLAGLLAYFRGQESERFLRYRDLTLRQALDRFFDDRKLELLLTADCPHWGSPPKRTSFVFDAMLRLSYFLGNYYPARGSQDFADRLAHRFEESGGEILMSSRVERILVEEERVAGVELETTRGPLVGRYRVTSPVVVSNGDLLQTVRQLLPETAVDPAYLDRLESLRPSFPCFLSHLGLRDTRPEEVAPLQGYYWEGWDPDEVGGRALRCKIFVPTLYAPDLAPAGGQVVVLQKVQELDRAATATWGAREWKEHKAATERRVTDHLRRLMPDLEDRLVVQLSASARTSERFTLNHGGAMLGWEMSPEQLGEGRPDVRGPVEGLYFVGHWTRPGGGITPVIVSAQRVAGLLAGTPARVAERGLSVH